MLVKKLFTDLVIKASNKLAQIVLMVERRCEVPSVGSSILSLSTMYEWQSGRKPAPVKRIRKKQRSFESNLIQILNLSSSKAEQAPDKRWTEDRSLRQVLCQCGSMAQQQSCKLRSWWFDSTLWLIYSLGLSEGPWCYIPMRIVQLNQGVLYGKVPEMENGFVLKTNVANNLWEIIPTPFPPICLDSSMVEPFIANEKTRVRFPIFAPMGMHVTKAGDTHLQ